MRIGTEGAPMAEPEWKAYGFDDAREWETNVSTEEFGVLQPSARCPEEARERRG